MRKTYIYSANLKLLYFYLHCLRVRKIERINNFDILLFARTNIL